MHILLHLKGSRGEKNFCTINYFSSSLLCQTRAEMSEVTHPFTTAYALSSSCQDAWNQIGYYFYNPKTLKNVNIILMPYLSQFSAQKDSGQNKGKKKKKLQMREKIISGV